MRYSSKQIVFQEIPNEISIAFHITGCPLRCLGCHSSIQRNSELGNDLNEDIFRAEIEKNIDYVSCVLFLGGEWDESQLCKLLDISKAKYLNTALYTGLEFDEVSSEIKNRLTYLKYGPFVSSLGPLSSSSTNQKLINLKTNECLNHYFLKERGVYDSINRNSNSI